MGFPNSSKLSRIEVYAYEPHASATIALSIILDEPIEQLFDGIYRQALVTIREHARDLLREFDRCDTRPSAKQRKRLALIKDLAHSI